MRLSVLYFISAVLLFTACKNHCKKRDENKGAVDMHNSRSSLDWQGSYYGILPCADCEGIETVLEISTDSSYYLQTTYLGKGDETVNHEFGTFKWDESGNNITLNNKPAPNQYKVGEGILYQMDLDGNLITGNLSENYILRKH